MLIECEWVNFVEEVLSWILILVGGKTMDQNNTHYKESEPESTVSVIRNLLFENSISVIEKDWLNSGDCYHSLSLNVEGTSFSVNGKGVTPSLALASAHGELMERLQNMTIFKLIYDFSKKNYEERGFYFAPDEKIMKWAAFLNYYGPWIKEQISAIEDKNKIIEMLKKWQLISYCDVEKNFVCLPFYHVNSGNIDCIPVIMLSKMYTSNGMAAGNTPEEALVQGISEIYERYATIQILKNKICPPEIPRKEIEDNENLHIMTQAIEKTGRYRLYFKDCSMGIGLPVAAVICVDTKSGKYFVKFGAHPVYEIAIERTLTELLQGQSLDEMKGMRPYMHDTKKACSRDNIYGIMINGCGSYPYSFFNEDADYEHEPFLFNETKDNTRLMEQMVKDIISRGWSLFVRDVSFLGFPSYQILIPGISEVEPFDDIKGLEKYSDYCKTKRSLKIVNALSKPQIKELALRIDKNEYLKYILPAQWLHIDEGSCSWVYKNSYFMISALYILAEEFSEGARVLTKFLSEYDRFAFSEEPFFFRGAASYLTMKSENMPENEIIAILKTFYTNEILEKVILDFSSEKLINSFIESNSSNIIKGNNLLALYTKLNVVYSAYRVNQNELKETF